MESKYILTLFIVGLIIASFCIGYWYNTHYSKKLISVDEDYEPELENNIIDIKELKIHLCSTSCAMEYMSDFDEYEYIKNDSFIVNNKLNTTNCITCRKELRSA